MKIKALTNLMNDHGTKRRVKVLKHGNGVEILTYQGKVENMDEETASLKVNSFTVLGEGFIEIHAQ